MLRKLTFAAALLAATALTGVANAKTLVYCSEASPAQLRSGARGPAATTSTPPRAPSITASSSSSTARPTIEPGLAESWEISDDGLEYTFKLRPGVKFQTTDYFTPTRDLNADDVIFSFERQWKEDNPVVRLPAGHRPGNTSAAWASRISSRRSTRSTT